MSIIRRSFALSAATKYTQLVLMLGSNVVLARLLTPGEIGVYAVAAVLAGIAQTFRDMGIGQYLIREPEINHAKLRVAFTLMTTIAWTIGFGLMLSAGVIADFYGEPVLGTVLRIQSLSFFIIPFGAISLTLLKREFRFGSTYVVEVFSAFTNTTLAVTLAALGLGALSLAWASVAGVCATVTGAILARRGQFAFLPTYRGSRAILGFGGYVTATQLLKTMSRDIPELMIGKMMGMSSLAYFNKAMFPAAMFGRFFMGAINPVLLPAFSKKNRENDFEAPFLHGLACLTAFVIPSLVLAAFLSDWIIIVIFGPQWEQAVDPMRIFALATAIGAMTSIFSQALVALGYPQAPMKVQLVTVSSRIALIALAVPYGLVAIAWAWFASVILGAILQFHVMRRLSGIDITALARTIAPSIVLGCPVAVAVGAVALWVSPAVTVASGILTLVISGGAFALIWLGVLAFVKHPLYEEALTIFGRFFRNGAQSSTNS